MKKLIFCIEEVINFDSYALIPLTLAFPIFLLLPNGSCLLIFVTFSPYFYLLQYVTFVCIEFHFSDYIIMALSYSAMLG